MIPFNTLQPLHAALKDEIDAAVQRVMLRGWYILGPEVEAFEQAFAAYHGVGHAVGVANGTDAIELALKAYDIGAGDEVITVSHTALPTVCAVERAGATPILVDIDPRTYTIDPAAVEAAITPRTKAILPVHIYGQMADMDALMALAEKHHLLLIEDCAQAHGSQWRGKLAGTIGHAAAYSFYPTKNLGAYGDGGAVITNDAAIAAKLKRIRNYGQVATYEYAEKGMNSRLDEIQAAILGVKLNYLKQHNDERRAIAAQYNAGLKNVVTPVSAEHAHHVYHLYVVQHPQRDALISALQTLGVGTKIHYPTPVHLAAPYQPAYAAQAFPVTEQAARTILSLPLYIGMPAESVQTVIDAVAQATEQLGVQA